MNDPNLTKIGRYEILGEIGKGAMGTVHLARDPIIGRSIALKTVTPDNAGDADDLRERRSRLVREAQLAGILSHPNIVTVYDVVELPEDGTICIAMEHVDGESLSEILALREPLSLDFTLNIISQVAAALDYAHSKDVTHRDIKPGNILLTEGDRVKITDFGIAHLRTPDESPDLRLFGTPNYLAPERLLGKPADPRSDLFSLGVVLYEMVTRRLPFHGESLAELTGRIVRGEYTPPERYVPDLPPGLSRMIARALHTDPDERCQRAGEVAEELWEVMFDQARLSETVPTKIVELPAVGDEGVDDEPAAEESDSPSPEATMPVAAATAAEGAPEPNATILVQPDIVLAAAKGAGAVEDDADAAAAADGVLRMPEVLGPTEGEESAASTPPAPPAAASAAAAPGAPRAPGGRRVVWLALALLGLLVVAGGVGGSVYVARWLAAVRARVASPAEAVTRVEVTPRYAVPGGAEQDPEAVVDRLRRAAEKAPDSDELADRLERAEFTLALEQAGARAVELDGLIAAARRGLSRRDAAEARRALAAALRLDPGNAEAKLLAADVQRLTGELAAEQAAAAMANRPEPEPVPVAAVYKPPEPLVLDPTALGPAVSTLRIEFESEQPEGVLTIYSGEEQIFREAFRFIERRRKGIKRLLGNPKGTGGVIQSSHEHPAGAASLRVYLSLPGRAAQLVSVEGSLPRGVERALRVRVDDAGGLTADLE